MKTEIYTDAIAISVEKNQKLFNSLKSSHTIYIIMIQHRLILKETTDQTTCHHPVEIFKKIMFMFISMCSFRKDPNSKE